jgi:hypothetical protein
LQVAEDLCPWGEAAANLRMQYLATILQWCNCADRDDAAALRNTAMRIAIKLFGPARSKRPPRASDYAREE